MRAFIKPRNRWFLLGLIAGCAMLVYGVNLAAWRPAQVGYYNLGLQAYQNGDFPLAVKAFDRSLASYKAEQHGDWLHRFVYPKPSRELAAQADFQKAKALLRLQQAKPAVEAFKESLKLNPGNDYAGVSLSDAQRMEAEAFVVKYDLELLFKNSPSLAQQEGKGKGKGQGKPGNQQVPGQEPGSKPGKGNRDDI